MVAAAESLSKCTLFGEKENTFATRSNTKRPSSYSPRTIWINLLNRFPTSVALKKTKFLKINNSKSKTWEDLFSIEQVQMEHKEW